MVLKEIKKLRIGFTQWNIALQNMMVQVERNKQQNRFPPINSNDGHSNNGRIDTSLGSTNMVVDFSHFFQACQYFQGEIRCIYF